MGSVPKTFEAMDGELCEYCPLPEDQRGPHCKSGYPIMFPDCCCDEAYINYLGLEEEE
jgi:hypothetical protein